MNYNLSILKSNKLAVLFTLSVLFSFGNFCKAQQYNAEPSVLKKIEQEPLLNGFKFGQKDLFTGISDDAESLINRISKEFPDEPMVRNDQNMTGDEYELYVAAIRPVLINGTSMFENDNKTISLQIMELPNNRYLFNKKTGDQAERMNASEFLKYVQGVYDATGEKFHQADLPEAQKTETRYVLVKPIDRTAQSRIAKEVTEIEDLRKEIPSNVTLVSFAIVDEVPAYPGCEGNNVEKKQCMQENIAAFVNENFNTGLAKELGLKGKQIISVMFEIDEQGMVTDIKTRGDSPEMKGEAERVVSLLPKMKPGMQGGKEVGVIYALPIIFEAGK